MPAPALDRMPHRRRALVRFGALALGGWGAGCVLRPGTMQPATPPLADTAAGFRLAGEWEPVQVMWLGYDAGHEAFTVELALALQAHVPLKLLARDEAQLQAARALLAQAGVNVSAVEFMVDELAIFFLRDAAVFTAGPAGRNGVVDFKWSQYGLPAWCARRHGTGTNQALERYAACAAAVDPARDEQDRRIARLAGAGVFSSPLALEGGGIECNGRGVALVSAALAQQRNPGRSLAEMQAEFLQLPGISKLIWLAEGLASDPHLRATITGPYVAWGTGGHSDEFVRFADARTLLLAWPDDADAASHPVARLSRQRMARNFDILSQATDANGAPFRIIKVPLPRAIERRVVLCAAADAGFSEQWTADYFAPAEQRREGQVLTQVASASYLNFVLANGVVVLPGYEAHGTPRSVEARVKALFEQAFPGRVIRFVNALGLNWVGGGAHCATLSQPRA